MDTAASMDLFRDDESELGICRERDERRGDQKMEGRQKEREHTLEGSRSLPESEAWCWTSSSLLSLVGELSDAD